MFVCFAPRENPQIAIAVAVENAGFGSTWAAPIASILIEKYLTDSIRTERMKDVDRIASANLMPSYLKRKQFIADSTRAYFYFNLRKDSSYIKKFLHGYKAGADTKNKPADKRKVNTEGNTAFAPEPLNEAITHEKSNSNKAIPRYKRADTAIAPDDKHLKKAR